MTPPESAARVPEPPPLPPAPGLPTPARDPRCGRIYAEPPHGDDCMDCAAARIVRVKLPVTRLQFEPVLGLVLVGIVFAAFVLGVVVLVVSL